MLTSQSRRFSFNTGEDFCVASGNRHPSVDARVAYLLTLHCRLPPLWLLMLVFESLLLFFCIVRRCILGSVSPPKYDLRAERESQDIKERDWSYIPERFRMKTQDEFELDEGANIVTSWAPDGAKNHQYKLQMIQMRTLIMCGTLGFITQRSWYQRYECNWCSHDPGRH